MSTKYLAIYDREDGWRVIGQAPWEWREVQSGYTRSGNLKYKKVRVQPNYVIPVPEHASCFIAGHRIIIAESEAEACRVALTFPKPKYETLLPSRSLNRLVQSDGTPS